MSALDQPLEIDDQFLNIQTQSIIYWGSEQPMHYESEPTSYSILQYLLDYLTVSSQDVLVDFGCGTGRVLCFMNYQLNLVTRGVESHPTTLKLLEYNIADYFKAHPNQPPIELYPVSAQDYSVQADETLYYFFNPFALPIFKQVVRNIEKSIEQFPRTVRLICYYPYHFKKFLETESIFEPVQEITVPTGDWTDYFIIYQNKER